MDVQLRIASFICHLSIPMTDFCRYFYRAEVAQEEEVQAVAATEVEAHTAVPKDQLRIRE